MAHVYGYKSKGDIDDVNHYLNKEIMNDIPQISIPDYGSIMAPDPIRDAFQNYTPKTVLVLGNGFDLSLKMKTSYKDFASSTFWPFSDKEKYAEFSLPYFLNSNYDKAKSWFDLEELLAIYASSNNIEGNIHKGDSSLIEKDKEFFKILVSSLTDYLQQEQENFVERIKNTQGARRASVAHIVLQMLEKKEHLSIFSFNYTDLCLLARQFILGFDADVHYVHGSLRDKDIILGAGDSRLLDDNYFDFYKSANERYKSNNLIEELSDADEVYIFGHSLGKNDQDYFFEFFNKSIYERKGVFHTRKLKLRIFTKDTKSSLEIKKQIMMLTNHHLTGLYAHCDFKVYKNDDLDVSSLMADLEI